MTIPLNLLRRWREQDKTGEHPLMQKIAFRMPILRDSKFPVHPLDFTPPAKWLNLPQDKVLANRYLSDNEMTYRPGKLREYNDNIRLHAPLMKRCLGAAKLKGVAKGRHCHLVGAGPSVIGQEAQIEAVCADPNNFIIAVNKATALCPRYDMVVWSERTSNPRDFWTPPSIGKPIVVTTPHSHLGAVLWALEHGVGPYLYNIATWNPDSMGWRIRQQWDRKTIFKSCKLLELPAILETMQVSMMLAYWVGCRDWTVWGADYCWYDPDRYYYFGSKPADPEDVWRERCSSGDEDVGDKSYHVWLHTVATVIDRAGKPAYCTPFLYERAALINCGLLDYMSTGGVKLTHMAPGGLVGNVLVDDMDRRFDVLHGGRWSNQKAETGDKGFGIGGSDE